MFLTGEERWRVLRLHVEDQIALAALARETGISTRTLQRWLRLYRAGGASALDLRPRTDAGIRRIEPEMVRFIEERFFGTINTEVLPTRPGHLGPGNRKPPPALDLPGLDRAIGSFVADYNDRTHSELGTSPRDVWVAGGWLPGCPNPWRTSTDSS